MTREAAQAITDVCAAWWDRMPGETRQGQQPFAEEVLRLLGWDQPLPFSARASAAQVSALPYLLRGGNANVAAFFVMPGTLDPPSAVRELGLDFCPTTRILLADTQSLRVHYILVSDLQRFYLYDVVTEELLIGADDLRGFNEEIAPVLNRAALEAGALDEVRRAPCSQVAGALREWSARWTNVIAQRGRIPEDRASLVIDRLIAARHVFDHAIMRRTKRRLEQRFARLIARASEREPTGVGRELNGIFHDMWFDWRMDLFEVDAGLDAIMDDDAIAVPLLREYGLMGKGKWAVASVLESFNHGDPGEKLRVRMVPDLDEEREHYLGKQRVETVDDARIEVDLFDEGYRAVLYWFDRIVNLYDSLEVEFDASSLDADADGAEPDLFEWSARDAARPSACGDKLTYACERGFGVYYTTPQQLRVSRLLLTLHVIARYHETQQPINRFPSFENVFNERPRTLPSDQKFWSRPDAGAWR